VKNLFPLFCWQIPQILGIKFVFPIFIGSGSFLILFSFRIILLTLDSENHFFHIFFINQVLSTQRTILLANRPFLQALEMKKVPFVAIQLYYVTLWLELLYAYRTLLHILLKILYVPKFLFEKHSLKQFFHLVLVQLWQAFVFIILFFIRLLNSKSILIFLIVKQQTRPCQNTKNQYQSKFKTSNWNFEKWR